MNKFLLVDDNDFSLSLSRELIDEAAGAGNIEFITAKDGKEAVKRFKESEPNEITAIFMDIVMPEMSGILTLREIRSMEREDAKSVPIIMVSAMAAGIGLVDEGDEALITDYIQKPISIEKFKNTLEKIAKVEG